MFTPSSSTQLQATASRNQPMASHNHMDSHKPMASRNPMVNRYQDTGSQLHRAMLSQCHLRVTPSLRHLHRATPSHKLTQSMTQMLRLHLQLPLQIE